MGLPILEIGQGQLREGKGLPEISQLREGASWDFTSCPGYLLPRCLKVLQKTERGKKKSPGHTEATENV